MIGVVADDITGANDIGIMFAKAHRIVHVVTLDTVGAHIQLADPHPDVLVLDTNSRLDEPQAAYAKVFHAVKELERLGCTQYINKTCSVFRGNIGAEFDAMLDALQQNFAVVVLGFPKNGRVTRDAIHYVHGKRLQDSEFRHDPAHPMRQSNLVDILQQQTDRTVRSVDHTVVSQGPRLLEQRLREERETGGYVILDVLDQEDLQIISEAAAAIPVLCGSSALAEELGQLTPPASRLSPPAFFHELPPDGVLIAAGSLMPQTTAQIEYLRRSGTHTLELTTRCLGDPEQRQRLLSQIVDEAAAVLGSQGNILIFTSRDTAADRAQGPHHTQLHRLVSDTMAQIVKMIHERVTPRKLIIAGGETSAAVCRVLGITAVQVWQEIEPGLPSCITFTDEPQLLVLKSGSFGSASFFAKAVDHLNAV